MDWYVVPDGVVVVQVPLPKTPPKTPPKELTVEEIIERILR